MEGGGIGIVYTASATDQVFIVETLLLNDFHEIFILFILKI